MLEEIEALFAARGRTAKGRRVLVSIYRSGMTAINNFGAGRASMETIAANAGLTQAALRHYFPTRDHLLTALFVVGANWFRAQLAAIVAKRDIPATSKLEKCVQWHLEFMESVDSTFWLEASAYWIRTAPDRRVRNEFYRWMVTEYGAMIGTIRPELKKLERQGRALAVVSLVLGSWITHGRGSAWHRDFNAAHRRRILVQSAMNLVTA